jgi:membrane-bound metal-dependent hydrolase YbcI (DUF457 family)
VSRPSCIITRDAPNPKDIPPMMARSHALLGAAGWLAAAPVASDAVHQSLDLPTLAASTMVCAGAALLPDLDHHDGLIANSLGPPTRLLARGVSAISGGHRHATHSLLFAVLAGWIAWGLLRWAGRPAQLVLSLLCAGFALRAVHLTEPLHERRLHWSAIALAAGAITYAEARFLPGLWHWLPIAIAVGCLLHVVGDVLTPEGVPLLWPWNERVAIPVLDHTNDWTETFVVVPVLGVLIFGLAWVHFAAVRSAALTWLDGLAR